MEVLLVGAYGQVGQQLIRALSNRVSMDNTVCRDIKQPPSHLNFTSIYQTINQHKITQVHCYIAICDTYHNIHRDLIWELVQLLRGAQDVVASIAAFGTNTPKDPTHSHGTKHSLWHHQENWIVMVLIPHKRYRVDVRSYPGLVGYVPSTTDYAVDIFDKAKKNQDGYLTKIYTDDATLQLMDASDRISVRTSHINHIPYTQNYNRYPYKNQQSTPTNIKLSVSMIDIKISNAILTNYQQQLDQPQPAMVLIRRLLNMVDWRQGQDGIGFKK